MNSWQYKPGDFSIPHKNTRQPFKDSTGIAIPLID
jgi:hypothetical protein